MGPRCRCYAAGAGRSSGTSRGGRAPRRTCRGSPRSAYGTSITSKSRGTHRRREDSPRLARATRARSSAARRASSRAAGRRRRARSPPPAAPSSGLSRLGAVALLLGERRLVDEHVRALGEHLTTVSTGAVSPVIHDAPPAPGRAPSTASGVTTAPSASVTDSPRCSAPRSGPNGHPEGIRRLRRRTRPGRSGSSTA